MNPRSTKPRASNRLDLNCLVNSELSRLLKAGRIRSILKETVGFHGPSTIGACRQALSSGEDPVKMKIGVIHPGAMGVSLAAAARQAGQEVFWASKGRSVETRLRAESNELQDVGTIQGLVDTCSVIVSICPPYAAEAVANQVTEYGFKGTYLDANAISPDRVERMSVRMARAGASLVDGSVIGGPAPEAGNTTLYLAGERADLVAGCFSAVHLETQILDGPIGRASALKMCYAAYSKGTTALLLASLAAAEHLHVRKELEQEWSRADRDSSLQAEEVSRRVTQKAWRFVGEMEEIQRTFVDAGLPGGFHAAASGLFGRLAHFKGESALPDVEDVLLALIHER